MTEEEGTPTPTPDVVLDDKTAAVTGAVEAEEKVKKPKRKSSKQKSASPKRKSSKTKKSVTTDAAAAVEFSSLSVDPDAILASGGEKNDGYDDEGANDQDGGAMEEKPKKGKSKSKSKSIKHNEEEDAEDAGTDATGKKNMKKKSKDRESLVAAAGVAAGSASTSAGSSSTATGNVDRNAADDIPDEHGFRHRCFAAAVSAQDAQALDTFLQRQFRRMARNPCLHLWTALLISLALSFIALIVGEFSVSAETGGWQSRGTLIADRQQQLMMAVEHQEYLMYGGEDAWNDLIQNVQKGWESDSDDDGRRLLSEKSGKASVPSSTSQTESRISFPAESFSDYLRPVSSALYDAQHESPALLDSNYSSFTSSNRFVPFRLTDQQYRRLQDESATDSNNPLLSGCDMTFYQPTVMTWETRLWPVWQTNSPSTTALNADVLRQQCIAEANTQSILEGKGLCFGCPDDKCLPPFSIVFYARLQVENGFNLDCDQLAEAWRPFQSSTEQQWQECVTTLKETYDPNNAYELPENCPFGFYPTLVQTDFDVTLVTQYTSTIFATYSDDDTVDELYKEVDTFDRGGDLITAAYDTQYEDFAGLYVDSSLGQDMALALGSALVVSVAIMLHTRSPLITGVGLLQIVLSFPLSYFVYKLVAGLDFFPFLNFLGIFVVFALGAGDIFVAIDKWKNARVAHPDNSTEYVAAIAFPDALVAMFLTTLTTAIAFFATAICPVAPIKMFAIFCGLLIIFDYLMNVLLVFPALVIYDKAMIASAKRLEREEGSKPSCWMCCVSCTCCGFCGPKAKMHQLDDLEDAIDGHGVTASKFIRTPSREMSLDEEAEGRAKSSASFIQRVMLGFYYYLHLFRWPLLAICIAAFAVCVYFATQLELPLNSDVRLLNEDVMFEQAYNWRLELLSENLEKLSGAGVYSIWGVIPADTGDQNNPASWTQLVLDEQFDMSSEEAQLHLLNYCDDIFEEEFASPVSDEWVCALKVFDSWLAEQATTTSADEIYTEHCAGATGLPMPQANFDVCISKWAFANDETSILSRNEKVQIVMIPWQSRVRYDSPFDILGDEWRDIEDWMTAKNNAAPDGVSRGYFNNADWWWWDTNGAMLSTAYSAAAIALGCSAAVILFSSQSLVLTLFSTLTIGYVLTAVTSMLVAIGWTLGFLESICFAILIGVSVDFVIHFSHAYSHKHGEISRGDRTKYAVVKMGPSILATAATTILSAVVMLFTIITFFQKFALILFFAIIQATLGSFIFFLTFTDCIGPTNPTYLVDQCVDRCCTKKSAPSLDDIDDDPVVDKHGSGKSSMTMNVTSRTNRDTSDGSGSDQ